MKIAPVSDFQQYDLLAQTNGSVFNRLSWLKLFGKGVEVMGIYDNGNNLIGGFHLFKFKKYGFTVVANPPFTPNAGLFFIDRTSNKSSNSALVKEVVEQLSEFLSKGNNALVDLTLPASVTDTQPLQWKGFNVRPRYTYIIDLEQKESDIWDHFSSQRRKSIRKALSDGFEVKRITDLEKILPLISVSLRKLNSAKYFKLAEKILTDFTTPENSYAFGVYSGDDLMAVTFCIHDHEKAYYLLGGNEEKMKHHGTGPLSMWECIRFSQQIGLKKFDFEGSMIPAVEEYFREFGGVLTPYYSISHISIPLKLLKLVKIKG